MKDYKSDDGIRAVDEVVVQMMRQIMRFENDQSRPFPFPFARELFLNKFKVENDLKQRQLGCGRD